jgi:hypothetical protein
MTGRPSEPIATVGAFGEPPFTTVRVVLVEQFAV